VVMAERAMGGRPRDPSLDLAFREAALDLLAERGYDNVTIEAVAARAGAGKTSVYRRWSTKAELVIDALNDLRPWGAVPDTGSLRGDLKSFCAHITEEPNGRALAAMRGLAAALPHDGELMTAFDQHFVAPRRAALRTMFERAIERGEMTAGRDLDLLTSVLPALMLHRVITTGTPPDPTYAARVTEEVLFPAATAKVYPAPSPKAKQTSGPRRQPAGH
jgi:AcrR family transcriptional regulator